MEIKKTIASSTILIVILTGIGYSLSFLGQCIIANYFGVSKELDSFVVASIIPEFFFGLTNAFLLTPFIILYPEICKKEGKDAARRFMNLLLTLTCFFLLIISILLFVYSSQLAAVIAPGFLPAQQILTGGILKIIACSVFFLGLISLFTSILYLEDDFFASKVLRIMINIGIIFSTVFLSRAVGVMSLAVGTTAGIIVACFTQYIFLKKKHYSFSFSLDINNSYLKEIFLLSLPLLMTSLFFYLNKLGINMIASTAGEGSISALNYAFLIINIPVILFSESLATVLFPHLRKRVTNEEIGIVNNIFVKSVLVIIVIIIPIMVFFMIFYYEIIHLILERGAFTSLSTEAVSRALWFYAFGLIPLSLVNIIGSVLHALKKVQPRMYFFFCLFFSNIFLAYFFAKIRSYQEIALGTSISYWIFACLGIYYLSTLLPFAKSSVIFSEVVKIFFASAIVAAAVYFLHSFFTTFSFFSGLFWETITLLVWGVLILGIYWCLLNFMQSKAEKIIIALIKKQFPREKNE